MPPCLVLHLDHRIDNQAGPGHGEWIRGLGRAASRRDFSYDEEEQKFEVSGSVEDATGKTACLLEFVEVGARLI